MSTGSPKEKDDGVEFKGWLFKRGGGQKGMFKSNAWRKRFCVLTSKGVLYYYKTPTQKNCKGSIQVEDFEVDFSEDTKPHSFTLTPRNARDRMSAFRQSIMADARTTSTTQVKQEEKPKEEKKIPAVEERVRVYCMAALSENELGEWMKRLKAISRSLESSKRNLVSQRFDELLQQHSIPPSELSFSEKDVLGKGASGVVMKGIWQNTTTVAIKALNNIPEFTDRSELEGFYKEIQLLSNLRHPSIVWMFGYSLKNDFLCLVTEFVGGGDLNEHIFDPNVSLPLSLILEIAMCVAKGMHYLHKKGVIHRDLKPHNILVVNWAEGAVKVCDFGLSSQTLNKSLQGADNQNVVVFGTPAYAAPELPDANHTDKVDVYSYTLILYEMITRQPAWARSLYGSDITKKVLAGERPKIPDTVPIVPKDLMVNDRNHTEHYHSPGQLSSECNFCNVNGQVANLLTSGWSNNPDERPPFQDIFKTLTDINGILYGSVASEEDGSILLRTVNKNPKSATLRGQRSSAAIVPENLQTQILKIFEGAEKPIPFNQFIQKFIQIVEPPDNKTLIERITDLNWLFMPVVPGIAKPPGVFKKDVHMILSCFPEFKKHTDTRPGFTIKDFVDFCDERFFMGSISTERTNDLLRSKVEGSFLLRFSSSQTGQFVLSVIGQANQVKHFRLQICKTPEDALKVTLQDRTFSSIEEILELYANESIDPASKQPFCLIHACNRNADLQAYM